jgi:hypothetical protein
MGDGVMRGCVGLCFGILKLPIYSIYSLTQPWYYYGFEFGVGDGGMVMAEYLRTENRNFFIQMGD